MPLPHSPNALFISLIVHSCSLLILISYSVSKGSFWKVNEIIPNSSNSNKLNTVCNTSTYF